MSGSQEEKPKVVAAQEPVIYCVCLAAEFEQYLKKEILSKKRGKNRKLTKDDKALINAKCADGIERFKQYAFQEAMRMMREIAEHEREACKEDLDEECPGAAEVAVAVASAALEESLSLTASTSGASSESSSQKSE